MTKDEFIDGYMARSGIAPQYRHVDGYELPGDVRWYAAKCDCKEDGCAGWSMVQARDFSGRVFPEPEYHPLSEEELDAREENERSERGF